MINQKGNITLIVTLILLAVLIAGGAYYLGTQKGTAITNSPIATSTANPEPQASANNTTADWKTYVSSGANSGISLLYPPSWVIQYDEFISEKPLVYDSDNILDKSKIYNSIDILKYDTQLLSTSTNAQWFDKISSLNDPLDNVKSIITKLESGTVKTGEQYVMFKEETGPKAVTDTFKSVKVYVLKNQTIYQLNLMYYDDNGLAIFKQIIPTITIK